MAPVARGAVHRDEGRLLRAAEDGRTLLFSELARRYLANRELVALKRSTLIDYESYARVHLLPNQAAASWEAFGFLNGKR